MIRQGKKVCSVCKLVETVCLHRGQRDRKKWSSRACLLVDPFKYDKHLSFCVNEQAEKLKVVKSTDEGGND